MSGRGSVPRGAAPAFIETSKKARKEMEKKIYAKPESEVLEMGLESSLMMFGSNEMEFKPRDPEPGVELPDV